jgi:hypothetical protein
MSRPGWKAWNFGRDDKTTHLPVIASVSEAIQRHEERLDCFVAVALRNDRRDDKPSLRRTAATFFRLAKLPM